MPIGEMSRRLAAVSVPEHLVLELILTQGSNLPQYVNIPMLQVPEGSKLHSVRHEYMSRSFLFLVEHESFSEVKPGDQIPILNFGIMTKTVKLDERYGEEPVSDPIIAQRVWDTGTQDEPLIR